MPAKRKPSLKARPKKVRKLERKLRKVVLRKTLLDAKHHQLLSRLEKLQ